MRAFESLIWLKVMVKRAELREQCANETTEDLVLA